MQRILGRTPGKAPEKAKEELKRRWNIQRRDPDAMDVDAVTTEKRGEWMKKGLCFNCNKPGHISRFFPDKRRTTFSTNTASTSSPPSYAPNPPKKMNPKEFVAHIQSVTAQMRPEEKEEFLDEAEKEGF